MSLFFSFFLLLITGDFVRFLICLLQVCERVLAACQGQTINQIYTSWICIMKLQKFAWALKPLQPSPRHPFSIGSSCWFKFPSFSVWCLTLSTSYYSQTQWGFVCVARETGRRSPAVSGSTSKNQLLLLFCFAQWWFAFIHETEISQIVVAEKQLLRANIMHSVTF